MSGKDVKIMSLGHFKKKVERLKVTEKMQQPPSWLDKGWNYFCVTDNGFEVKLFSVWHYPVISPRVTLSKGVRLLRGVEWVNGLFLFLLVLGKL